MTWRDVESGAPEIARLGRERLERVGVALLGTIRRDGSPRISPVEPFFVGGHLLFGAMSWSLKAHDLLRDPRCVLHNAVLDPDASEGEVKLYGRAGEVKDARIRDAPAKAWWLSQPAEVARVFSLSVEQAVFITWDAERGVMRMKRWSPARGFDETERPYP